MKDIHGFGGRYAVTKDGRVWSYPRVTHIGRGNYGKYKGYFLKLILGNNGYFSVTLTKQSNQVRHLVHRLVAQTYIPNPKKLPCVNHIDGDKLNNTLSNLEWCSYQQNNIHNILLGHTTKGERNHHCKLTKQQVLNIRSNILSKILYSKIAKKYSISIATVCDIKNKRSWSWLV